MQKYEIIPTALSLRFNKLVNFDGKMGIRAFICHLKSIFTGNFKNQKSFLSFASSFSPQILRRFEMEERILKCAIQNFLRLGIKAVTMDMIASELGVSKKTIYSFFKNKNELVTKCVQDGLTRDWDDKCTQQGAEDFMEEVIAANKGMNEMFETISPVFFYELEKLYPKEHALIENHKFEKVMGYMIALYEKGKTQGYVKPNIPTEIVMIMRMEQIKEVFKSVIYAKKGYSYVEVQKTLADFFIQSVLTEKGLQIYLSAH